MPPDDVSVDRDAPRAPKPRVSCRAWTRPLVRPREPTDAGLRSTRMTSLGTIHLSTAIAALLSGAIVLLLRKGTRRHRQAGWTYVASMILLNATALMIYRLFGGFGPFHAAALISLASLSAGTVAAVGARRARRRGDAARRATLLQRHYSFMTWSYVGLLAAAVSEITTRMPALRPRAGQGAAFAVSVVIATVLVIAVGA